MYEIGWFSTGKDEAARDLFEAAYKVPNIKIEFVFCNRDRGENRESDKFIKLADKDLDIPIITFSSVRFKPGLRKKNVEKWRENFDREVIKRLKNFKVNLVVLAGYMLICSPLLCKSCDIINLHPAEPGGPKGTWQEVIWQKIKNEEKESGVMIHLVTPELDSGPVITFCKYEIEEYDFDKIREQGLKREFPLIVETLRLLASGEIKLGERSRDLTEIINKKIKSRP